MPTPTLVIGHELADGLPWRPLESLREAEPVRNAAVILGRDVDTGEVFLLYGRHTLEKVLSTGQTAHLPALGLDIDRDAADLQIARELVARVKGRCDYMECEMEQPALV
jgi:hypothetical protein